MAATVAQLAARDFWVYGYLLVIEGWHIAFTDIEEIAGEGPESWIGVDAYGARRIVTGLEVPENIAMAIGILESGMPIDDGATFSVIDRERQIIRFMNDDPDTATAYERLSPKDDPAPATLIGEGGVDVPLHGMVINGEKIGDTGERRQFQVLPGVTMPGYDHAAIDTQDQSALRPSTIEAEPRWLEGRPVALYLLRRDPQTGAWASWQEQFDSGYSLIWWGTLRAASAQSFAWKLECEGPSSWLRRTLNANKSPEWRGLAPYLDLKPGKEDLMAVAFRYRTYVNGGQKLCAYSAYDPAFDTIVGVSPLEIAESIAARVADVAADAGVDATFTTYQQGSCSFGLDDVWIKVGEAPGVQYGGEMIVRLHRKVWEFLGWDLLLQIKPPEEVLEPTDAADGGGGKYFKPPGWGVLGQDPTSTGYAAVSFTTLPFGTDWTTAYIDVDNGGVARIYTPLSAAGVYVLSEAAQQRVSVGFEHGTYNEGQLARPVADKMLEPGACDTTGFIAIRGQYRTDEADATTMTQIAKLSWVGAGGAYADGSDGRAPAWLERWLDPRTFGAANDLLDRDWSGSAFEFAPVALLGYNLDKPDAAHTVLLRLLLSTGTAEWSGGFEGDDSAALTGAANVPADLAAPYLFATDAEIADLGLAIPQVMVNWRSFVDAAHALKGGAGGPLAKTKLLYLGPFDSQQVIQSILAPRGWCFTLHGGKYGLFARSAILDVEDAVVSLGPEDIAGAPDDLPPWDEVSFRPLEPIDLVEVEYGHDQTGGSGETKMHTCQARDPRAHQRRGNAKVSIDGRSLLADGSWRLDFNALWGDELARWYAEPHALVTVSIKGNKARDIWPGTIVRYTSPWIASREGQYGMLARVGRVTRTEIDLKTLAKRITILVQPGDLTSRRRFAPLARLFDVPDAGEAVDRLDPDARKLFCFADGWGLDAGDHDVKWFAEPPWLGVGGNARARLYQSWDGVTWEHTATFDVESINIGDGSFGVDSITYVAESLSGKVWSRRYGVIRMAPMDEQPEAAWPRAIFGVYCKPTGKFGDDDATGYKWADKL